MPIPQNISVYTSANKSLAFSREQKNTRLLKRKYNSDIIAVLVIFINLSSLYGPVGYLSGASSSRNISILLMLASFLYITLNFGSLITMCRKRFVLSWILLIWVAPLISVAVQLIWDYTNSEDAIYWGGVVSSSGALFVVTLLYSTRSTKRALGYLVSASVLGAVIGFCINFIDYDFIHKVQVFTSSQIAVSLTFSRMLGFFPHPNEAAIALVMYASILLLVTDLGGDRIAIQIMVLVVLFALVVMTGSRTSMLIGLFLLVGFVLRSLYYSENYKTKSKKIVHLFLAVAVTATILAVFSLFLPFTSDSTLDLGLSRIADLINALSGNVGAHDESLEIRVDLLDRYLELIADRPFVGYGLGPLLEMVSNGSLANVSQVSWLQWSAEFGVLYAVFAIIMFVWTARKAMTYLRVGYKIAPAGTALLLLVSMLMIATFSLVDIFLIRSVVVAIAVFIGNMYSSVMCNVRSFDKKNLRYNHAAQCSTRVLRWSHLR